MPTLRQGDRPLFLNLEAGKVLTVSAGVLSAGVVRTYPSQQGGESDGQQAFTAGQSGTWGPFLVATRFAVEVTLGAVTYTISNASRIAVLTQAVMGAPTSFAALSTASLPSGAVVQVAGLAPSPVAFEKTGFGWRPTGSFGLQPLRGDYTHTDAFNDVGIAWQTVLPAGLLNWGYVVIEPLVTFPNSASTKNITLRVNGNSFWNKSRTTSTHECPLIVIQARDNGMVNNPYWTNNSYISGGTSWASSNLAIDTTAAVELSLQVGFSAAGAGSETITVRYVRARFFPY